MRKLEKAILQAIEELGSDAYGVPVRRRVDEILNRTKWWNGVSIGAFYVACWRLEEKGYIGSYRASESAERDCRARMYFYVTRLAKEKQ